MASQLPPSLPPTPTAITGLTDDLLCEIFLRLPALPSLVCAAFACRDFRRAVRSSPAFRRSIRALHAPPLLFLFVETKMEVVPIFAYPWRCPDPLPPLLSLFLEPTIDPSCNGYLILDNVSRGPWRRAAYNPLTQALDLCIYEPDYILPFDFYTLPSEYGQRPSFEFYTLSCEDSQGMSRVVCVHHQGHVTPCTLADSTAVVFSCDTMEWQFSRKTTLRLPISDRIRTAMVVGGIICWRGWMYEQIVVLDTADCQFSLIDLPTPLKMEDEATYKLGETKDGKFCIVDIKEETLVSWFMTANDDKIWMMYNKFSLHPIVKQFTGCPMQEERCHVRLDLVAVIDGFVYLSIFYRKDTSEFEVYLSLCLETSEISEILKSEHRYNEGAQPYVMAWPPSLVHCKEESETEFTGECSVADDGPVGTREASNVLVAALQSLTQALVNDGDGNKEMVAELDAFLGPTEDDEGSLIRKITTLDARLRNARDCILRIRS
ncbi:unnamed protein product [Alopecurus aequalis]